MALSEDQVRKLGLLARLELSDEDVATIGPQLGDILNFFQKLKELDTDDVEPMTTALDVDNRWRKDELVDGLTRQQALQNSPQSDDECFLVPPVFGK